MQIILFCDFITWLYVWAEHVLMRFCHLINPINHSFVCKVIEGRHIRILNKSFMCYSELNRMNLCIFSIAWIVGEDFFTLFNCERSSWSWSYGSWIYNYLCNQCLSLVKLWVEIQLRWGILDATLCDKVFSDMRQVSSFLRVLGFLTATIY